MAESCTRPRETRLHISQHALTCIAQTANLGSPLVYVSLNNRLDSMRVQTHAVHFTADKTLLDFIQKKLDKLDTFHDKIVSAEVFLKLEGPESAKVKDKIVEIRLNIPGKELFVTERNKSFEAAIEQLMDVLKDKLVRSKEKRTDFSSSAIKQAQHQQEEEAVDQDEY